MIDLHAYRGKRKETFSLCESATGQWLRILSLPKGALHAQFIRLGMHEGQRVKCVQRLPGGTVVLQRNRQQIAVGHKLAKSIIVLVIAAEET